MKPAQVLISALVLATALAGCAVGQRLGWRAAPAEATASVRASCEDATRTLVGKADHATALGACLEAKTRQGLRD
jgi:hypothetical protein